MSDFETQLRMARAAGNTDAIRRIKNELRYSDDQPRDDKGEWTSGGGSGSDKSSTRDDFHGHLQKLQKIENNKASIKDMKRRADALQKKMYKPMSDKQRVDLKTNKQYIDDARKKMEAETDALKSETANSIMHPEAGQFKAQEGKYGKEYVSPSGDKITTSSFGGYNMQRVAPSADMDYTESGSNFPTFRKSWGSSLAQGSGPAKVSRDNFIEKHFGKLQE